MQQEASPNNTSAAMVLLLGAITVAVLFMALIGGVTFFGYQSRRAADREWKAGIQQATAERIREAERLERLADGAK